MATRVAVTTGAPASAAAFAPTLPSHLTGDRLLLFVTGKFSTTTIPTISAGWTLVRSFLGGTGTAGNDTGTVFVACYAKDATSSAETAPTVTPGATVPNSWEWICASYRPGAQKIWRDAIGASAVWALGGDDASTASPLAPAVTLMSGVTTGDALFAVGVVPTDLGTALGAVTFTQADLAGGTKSTGTTQYVENALGNDSAAVWTAWEGFTGTTAGANPSLTMVVTGASDMSGSGMLVALRETIDPNPIKRHYDESGATPEVASDTSTSFTPQASAKVYVAMMTQSAAAYTVGTPVDSAGTPLTWTKILDVGTTGGFRGRLTVFESSDTGGAPAARTIQVRTSSGTFWVGYTIWSIAGQSIKQQSPGVFQASGTTVSTGSLPVAATNGNIVVVVAGHNKDSGTPIPTPAGWTALSLDVTGGRIEFSGVFYRTNFTATSEVVSTASDSANEAVAALIEWQVGAATPAARPRNIHLSNPATPQSYTW